MILAEKLHIVGTSLGNIEDISVRALRFIFESDVVLAEDTRVFTKMKAILLEKLKPTIESLEINFSKHQEIKSYRDQNHDRISEYIVDEIKKGERVVSLFSDSGMPGISDPGWLLIDECIKNNIEIDIIPGATALVNALLLSGFSTDRFSFLGFLPRKPGKATKIIKQYLNEENTLIIYESPFRIIKTLELISKIELEETGEKIYAAACFEMTKRFQNTVRGEILEVIRKLKETSVKGECVICLRIKNKE